MVPLLQQSASAAATRARRSCSARAAAAGAQPPQEPGPSQPIGSSQPALMRRAQAADEPDAARQPWNVVTYITKKKTRKWDSTGNFVGQDDPEMLHAPAGVQRARLSRRAARRAAPGTAGGRGRPQAGPQTASCSSRSA